MRRKHSAMIWSSAAMLAAIGCGTPVSADTMSEDPRQRGGSVPGSGHDQPRSIQGQPDTVPGVGGPEAVVGTIASIKGDEFTIHGSNGDVRLRVTKDTNMICAGQEGAKVSTSREGVKERKEIPPTPFMQEQAEGAGAPQESKGAEQQQASAPAEDPSRKKSVIGTTDPKAKEDVARGSGFIVGGEGGCRFEEGDRVRVEASDMGTALLIKQLSEPGEGAKIAEQPQEESAR